MYEVEVKVEAAHAPVRERLSDLDAEPLGAVAQRDTYYDHPVRDFAETDEALRLREEVPLGNRPAEDASRDGNDTTPADAGTTATLTYKGPLVDDASKTREEVETVVGDPEAADAILRAVGFEPAAVVEKERERFAADGFVVSLDSVVDLGAFVEVEAQGGGDEVDGLRDGAFDLCRRLGLDPGESIRTSYLAMLLEAS